MVVSKSPSTETEGYRKTLWILGLHLFWSALVCLLGVWWGSVILSKSKKIAELELSLGKSALVAETELKKTRNMMVWEASTFLLLSGATTSLLLTLYRRDAKRARSLQAFFASVTHELRTPLTSIRLQAESIAESSTANPLIDRLLEDTTRLQSQVERTLELARLEAGGKLNPRSISLTSWIDRFFREVSYNLGNPGDFEIQFDRPNDSLDETQITADPAALQIIFRNIFENAKRHSKQKPVAVTVKLESEKEWVRVQVRNSGSAFRGDVRKLGRLFEKGENSHGAGVGLYLVTALATRMGGKCEFLSGTSDFTVGLNFRRAKDPTEDAV